MKETGYRINKMDMAKRFGLMEQSIKDSIKVEKNMEKVFLCGVMIALMKESFYKIIFMVKADTLGKMEEFMMVIG